MKIICSLTIAISVCLTSFTNATDKNAIMIKKVEDPFAGLVSKMGTEHVKNARKMMGSEGDRIEYKYCIQNIDFKNFLDMYEEMKEDAAEDGEFNDIKSIALIEKCPLPANGGCNQGNYIDYLYTDSNTLLQDQKEECEYSKSNKWIAFDSADTASDEDENSKALAVITVKGKEHEFRTNNNCISIWGDPVSTPVFSNDEFSFGMNQMGKENWDLTYMVPKAGSPSRMDLFKSKKHQVNYDEKVIDGSATMYKNNDSKITVDVVFNINCR